MVGQGLVFFFLLGDHPGVNLPLGDHTGVSLPLGYHTGVSLPLGSLIMVFVFIMFIDFFFFIGLYLLEVVMHS